MPIRNLLIVVLAMIIGLACYRRASRNRYAATIADAMGRIDDHFVEPVDRRELFEGSMRGMLRRLDPYSGYVSEEDYMQLLESMEQQFGGVGMVMDIDADTGRPMVLSPQFNSPAYQAGIRAGDIIWAINGEDTADLDSNGAIRQIRGEPGTSIVLSILSVGEEKPRKVTIERAIIPVESVLGYARRADGSWDFVVSEHPELAYIWVDSFGEETAAEILRALRATLPKTEALIIDLRRNAGGLLDAAVDVCDLFLSEGTIVTIKGRGQRLEAAFTADADEDFVPSQLPIVVLVDRFSASAAEIVAACLQDHNRATVIGERTWGKGTVQTVVELEGGRSAMRLTTATYWRPSGQNIHRSRKASDEDQWGVQPTKPLEVKLADDEINDLWTIRRQRFSAPVDSAASQDDEAEQLTDRQLQKAIEYLLDQLGQQQRQAA